MKKSYEYVPPSTPPNEGRSTMSSLSTVSTPTTVQESLQLATRKNSDYCVQAIKKDRSWYATPGLNDTEVKKDCKSNECDKKKRRSSSNAKRSVSVCTHLVEEEPAFMEKRPPKKTSRQSKGEKNKMNKTDKTTTKKSGQKKKKNKDDSVSLDNTDTEDKGSKEKLVQTQRCSTPKDAGNK